MKLLIHPEFSTEQRWSLVMEKLFQPTLYWACDYLSKFNHVTEGGTKPQNVWNLSVAGCWANLAVVLGLLFTWWRYPVETFSALLAICAGNSPVPGEFSAQRPVTRSFGVFFDLCLNKRLNKQSWGWWFEIPSRPLWRHCNDSISYSIRSLLLLSSSGTIYSNEVSWA